MWRRMRSWIQNARLDVNTPSTATMSTAVVVKRASGSVHSAGGRIQTSPKACTAHAMASGSTRRDARFIRDADQPKHTAPRTAATVPSITAGVGWIGPSCTISATPVAPQTQPSSLPAVSWSSLSHAEISVPNTTPVELSRATYPAGSASDAVENRKKGAVTVTTDSSANSFQWCHGQRWPMARMIRASVSVATAMRPSANTLGPSSGAATRIIGNVAPHNADKASSCRKWPGVTDGIVGGS